jgi:hypothetical protein
MAMEQEQLPAAPNKSGGCITLGFFGIAGGIAGMVFGLYLAQWLSPPVNYGVGRYEFELAGFGMIAGIGAGVYAAHHFEHGWSSAQKNIRQ